VTLGFSLLGFASFSFAVAGRFAAGGFGVVDFVHRFDWIGHFDRRSKAAGAIVAMRP
jgi:hypothetical protein